MYKIVKLFNRLLPFIFHGFLTSSAYSAYISLTPFVKISVNVGIFNLFNPN
jgi:hypothetical protein